MGRVFSLHTEVFSRLDETDAKILLPEPIDVDASRERMGRIQKPFGETKAVRRCVGWERWENRRNAGTHFVALLVVPPANEHERLAWLGHFLGYNSGRNRFFDSSILLFPFGEVLENFLPVGRVQPPVIVPRF